MSFSINRDVRPCTVLYENDDLRICVGQISRRGTGYEFHFEPIASSLKMHKQLELKAYGAQQAELLAVTERLTK